MASEGTKPTTGLNEALLPAYHELSSTDHGAYVFMTAVILVVVSGLALGVKLQTTVSKFRKLRWDDAFLIVAEAFAIGYTIAICRSVHHGLGRTAGRLTTKQVKELSQHYFASNILLYLSLAASKCSSALLIITIQPERWVITALYSVFGFSIAWAVAASLVMAFQCGPVRWSLGPTDGNTCIDQYSAHIGLRIVDIVTDIALVVLPARMVVVVQMSVYKKLVVIAMFGIRILTPIFTAVTLASLANFYNAPATDRPFQATTPSIWTSLVINVALVTTCLPAIKGVLMDWAAGVSVGLHRDLSDLQYASGHGKETAQSSGARNARRSQKRSHTTSKPWPDWDVRHAQGSYTNYALGGRGDRDQIADDADSKRGLTDGIVQTVDYQVEYEDERAPRHRSTSSDNRARI